MAEVMEGKGVLMEWDGKKGYVELDNGLEIMIFKVHFTFTGHDNLRVGDTIHLTYEVKYEPMYVLCEIKGVVVGP